MSKNPDTRSSLCGNCKHFVAGGLCELVRGQIKAKDTCDLHVYGKPQTIDTEVDPKYNKLDVNYKPGFMVETTTGDVAQKAIQMKHELLSRGIPEEEVHRAVIDYFSQAETPYDIMIKLKQKGDKILPYLLLMRKDSIKLDGDKVQVELLKLLGEN